MESLLERWDNEIKSMRSDMDSMQAAINWLRAGQNELEAQDEMLSDQLDGLHYGVVMLGDAPTAPSSTQRNHRADP
jgi:chromosome segregation ATPase